MENITEKKWFVYMGDHHEGPFSVGDIKTKVTTGAVTEGHYVWAEGMADWKVMTEIGDFRSVLGTAPPPKTPTGPALESSSKNGSGASAFSGQAEPSLEPPPASHHFSETTGSFDSLLSAAPDTSGVTEEELQSQSPNLFDPPPAASAVESFDAASAELPADAMPAIAEPAPREPVSQVSMQTIPQGHSASPAFDNFEIERAQKMAHMQTKVSKKNWALDAPETEHRKKRGFKLFLLMIVAMGAAGYLGYLDPVLRHPQVDPFVQKGKNFLMPFLGKFSDKLPFLNELLSPIPTLKDVSVEDLSNLRKTATSNLMEIGPKVAIALSSADIRRPTFYVATNLPDGAQFEIYIEGIGETLLNHFDFSARKRLVVMNRMGQTQNFEFQAGTALPQGDYLVSVYEVPTSDPAILNLLASRPDSPRQPPARALVEGNNQRKKVVDIRYYFLGGPKDATYESRLREYHEKLQVQTKQEIEELGQFTNTMSQGLAETMESFSRVKNSGNKSKLDAHLKLLANKVGMLKQFESEFQSWTPESISVLKFHSNLYMGTKASFEATMQVLALQNQYIEKKTERSSFDIQMGEAFSRATDLLTSIRAKIKKASELGPNPMGMPQKVE